MDITEQGTLVQSTLDIDVYDKISYLSEIRLYFYKNPVDVDALICMADMVDMEVKKSLLKRAIYAHKVFDYPNIEITEGELNKLLDKSRRILLTKYEGLV